MTSSGISIVRELIKVTSASAKYSTVGFPRLLVEKLISLPQFHLQLNADFFRQLIGEVFMLYFQDLGPIYGKIGQVSLSRLPERGYSLAESIYLTRLFSEWPAIERSELEDILDDEIPHWRAELSIHPKPLGVASMGQVHLVVDLSGRKWALKVIKPQAKKRLVETSNAIAAVISGLRKVAFSRGIKRALDEADDLIESFKKESDLQHERKTVEKFREKIAGHSRGVLKVPEICDRFSSSSVLCMEYFDGVLLSDIVSKKTNIPAKVRKKLARKVLKELLIQVFEVGLFHGDPHAGNLMLLEDGSVGLFDWGLSGELSGDDKVFVASVMRSVISADLDALIDALRVYGEKNSDEIIDPETIRRELGKFIKLLKPGNQQENNSGEVKKNVRAKPRLDQLFDAALEGADRIGIRVPKGLVIMAKSLLTIEGLAKGIDPDISLKYIAGPVLIRAAKPSFGDLWSLGQNYIKKKLNS